MGEQPVEGEVEPGKVPALSVPGPCQGGSERSLLVEQLGSAVGALPPRFDQDHERGPSVSRSTSRCSSAVSHGSQDSIPSNTWPSPRRSQCALPHGASPTSDRARSLTSSVGRNSRQPKSTTESTSELERWSPTENSLSRSTSSPQRSMRTGTSAVEPNTSTIEPLARRPRPGARPGTPVGNPSRPASTRARWDLPGRPGGRPPVARPRRGARAAAGVP